MARTKWIQADGNCQFRAFATALDGGLTTYEEVRRRVDAALREPKQRESLRPFFPDDVGYRH